MSKIEWCDRSDWNPIRGCTRVSEGCRHCYAEQIAGRFSDEGAPFHGFATRAGREGRWTGKVELIEERLTLPLKWRKPAVVFVNSAFDLFHEALDVIDIARVYATAIVAHLMRGHVFVTLTKRAKRQRELLTSEEFWEHVNTFVDDMIFEHVDPFDRRSDDARATAQEYGPSNPPPGIFAGVSIENQEAADERIPELLATPAAGRFVSAEPLLSKINFRRLTLSHPQWDGLWLDALTGAHEGIVASPPYKPGYEFAPSLPPRLPSLDAIIVGGESGPGARACWTPNVRSIVKQCAAAGVACYVKQLGANVQDRNDAGFDGENFAGNPLSTEWPDGTFDRIEHDLDGTRDGYQGAPVRIRLRDRKGGDPAEWPEDLRVRQLPWRSIGEAPHATA